MPKLHETLIGRKYYERDIPQLIKHVGTIAKTLEVFNKLNEQNYIEMISRFVEIAKEQYHQEQLKRIADEYALKEPKVTPILDMYLKGESTWE